MKPSIPLFFLGLSVLVLGVALQKDRAEQVPPADGVFLSSLPDCEKKGSQADGRKCYEEYLIELLKTQGADVAIPQMGRFETGSPTVKVYCHGIAHTLGHAGYEHYGSLSEALSHGTMDCFAGYFHGAIEVALPEAEDYSVMVRDACSGMSGRDGEFKFYQCVHGLGHGVTSFRQYDVEGALADCDLLHTAWQRESCWGGVFMENIDSKFVTAMGYERQGRLQDDESDFWPCLSVAEGYRPPCLRMITARILPKHNRDFSYAREACDNLTNQTYRTYCFESYGRDAAGDGLHSELSLVNRLCDAAPGDVQETCYETAAAVVATHYADPERAQPICDRAGVYQEACERGKKRIANSLAG